MKCEGDIQQLLEAHLARSEGLGVEHRAQKVGSRSIRAHILELRKRAAGLREAQSELLGYLDLILNP